MLSSNHKHKKDDIHASCSTLYSSNHSRYWLGTWQQGRVCAWQSLTCSSSLAQILFPARGCEGDKMFLVSRRTGFLALQASEKVLIQHDINKDTQHIAPLEAIFQSRKCIIRLPTGCIIHQFIMHVSPINHPFSHCYHHP